jgi:hypothetical protein
MGGRTTPEDRVEEAVVTEPVVELDQHIGEGHGALEPLLGQPELAVLAVDVLRQLLVREGDRTNVPETTKTSWR